MEKKSSYKTTGIGSLPHHNIDSALAYSFQHDIPFLPQLPIKNPNEFMIQHALECLPGLLPLKDNESKIDLKEWLKNKDQYQEQLNKALNEKKFQDFLPKYTSHDTWTSFLFELEEQKKKIAKIQIAGPLTAQLFTKLSDGESVRPYPKLLSQIYNTVLVESLAMVQGLKSKGITPLIFLDEPGLHAYMPTDPLFMTAFQEIELFIVSLKKQGAVVGIHCCSNTNWEQVLNLSLDYLSFDVALSLNNLCQHPTSLKKFYEKGGRFSFGVIPTDKQENDNSISYVPFEEKMTTLFKKEMGLEYSSEGCLITTACGLAFKTVEQTENYLSTLKELAGK